MNVQSTQDGTDLPLGKRPMRILEATLELVSEYGLTGLSIAKLAKRAEASPGIIYHYFESKDVLIHTLYREVLAKFTQAFSENIYTLPPAERLNAMWLSTFNFHAHHPQETVFLEQYKHSAYYPARMKEVDAPLERLTQTF